MQSLFFVIAILADGDDERITGYHDQDGDIMGVDSIDDPNIKVYKTEAVAWAKVRTPYDRIIRVHRDNLDASAVPE